MTSLQDVRVLVFQHLRAEHPGSLGEALGRSGATMQCVELDEDEAIPDLEEFDLLLVMGGPMDVWEEDAHPWLREEKAAIRHWVRELERPFLGVCLGHQLLADATGGTVGPMGAAEIGVMEFEVTHEGRRDPIISAMPNPLCGLQWHGAEVKRLPDDGILLARNTHCAIQAFRVGPVAWGAQFHVEASAETVRAWAVVPEYRLALESSGLSMDWLEAAVARHLPDMEETTEVLARGLVTAIAQCRDGSTR